MIMQNIKYCCGDIAEALDTEFSEDVLLYEQDTRSYYLKLYKNKQFTGFLKPLLYCPWCGIKLPKGLDEEWGKVLKKEYGMTTSDLWNKEGYWDESKIPQELRTDEWWKKRGL